MSAGCASLDDAESAVGTARLEELVCQAAGTLAWHYPRALEALRRDGELELDPLLSPDDVRSWEQSAVALASSGLERSLADLYDDLGAPPSADQVRCALEFALEERMGAVLDDAEWQADLDVARDLAGALEAECAFDGDADDLAFDLRGRFGAFFHPMAAEVLDGASFRATLLLSDPSDGDLAAMRRTLDSAASFLLDDRGGAWERPQDAGRCALDALCESQGTTLESVMGGEGGPFAESLRDEVSDALAVTGGCPYVAVLATLDCAQYCAATAAALGCPDRSCGLVVPPGAVVGLYDPANGAGSDLGVALARPLTVRPGDVRDVMPDGPGAPTASRAGWSVQTCYGLVADAWETRLGGPGAGVREDPEAGR